ncbi:ATP-binding cassette domain-containing protein [Paracoccus sp. S-4012]|uniref:ABC transporter ATP-binding protein n=1 Tax=Paracoccus sp. S-4012 TaxID=2665648 RepID=UPI0012AFFF39|nr:ABC transporter ATP-binding protein [Paracoccus sp. S-4012]MRX51467.1 ATP-binding cassette domain-containing protein [Paracoccus sp. S-4012]
MSAPVPRLLVEALVAGYRRDLPILHGVDLRVEAGEFVTVVGPNGAGKSTLLKAVAGLIPVIGGTVTIDGKPATGIATHCLESVGLAYVPQLGNVFASLTVAENLRLGASSLSRDLASSRIDEALIRFPDLARHRRHRAGALSGGQRQMLAVARAMLIQPAILMLDEPSAGLSPRLVGEVFEHLVALSAAGTTILMVEQNVKAAMRISDRTYVLADGRNAIDGRSDQLAQDPEMRRVYLGGGHRRGHAASHS